MKQKTWGEIAFKRMRKKAPNEERPQGEWKEHYGLYICSECGQIIGECKKNYCATCGAKMKGGVE